MPRCVSTSEGTIDVTPIPSTWWWCECQSDQRLRFFFGRVDVPCFLACSLLSSILTTSPVNLHIPASPQATSTPRRYDAHASMPDTWPKSILRLSDLSCSFFRCETPLRRGSLLILWSALGYQLLLPASSDSEITPLKRNPPCEITSALIWKLKTFFVFLRMHILPWCATMVISYVHASRYRHVVLPMLFPFCSDYK